MAMNKKYMGAYAATQAAKKGRLAAAGCSKRHWEELMKAPIRDFLLGRLNLGSGSCGLCQYVSLHKHPGACHTHPTACGLGLLFGVCYNYRSQYSVANKALRKACDAYSDGASKSVKDALTKRWRRRAKKMVDLLTIVESYEKRVSEEQG